MKISFSYKAITSSHMIMAIMLTSLTPFCAKAQEHRFYDRPAKIELAAAVTLSAFDSAQSCYNVTHKGHENFLPMQSCAGITAILTAEVAGQEALAYLFHRTHHHKLERMVRFISISANLDGIIYSKRKGAF